MRRKNRKVRAVMAGAWFAVVSLGIALLLGVTMIRSRFLVAAIPVATFPTGAVVWWMVCDRPAAITTKRGAIAGGAVGLLAHPAIWLLYFGYGAVVSASLDMVAFAIVGTLVWALVGTLILGVVTIPVGAVTGVFIAQQQRQEQDHT